LPAGGLARVCPLALDQAPVPGQQRSWRDQAMAAQDRDFMAQHYDLGVFRRLAAAEQEQPCPG
jgi:hypothetical protein